MKVLERKDGGWRKQTCTGAGNGGKGCGSVLLLDLADVYETGRHLRDESEYFTTFRCPVCHVETDIHNPPNFVAEEARKRPGTGGRARQLESEK